MAEKFYIKQNDTKPVIRAKLLDSAGNVANVTGAAVVFSMRVNSRSPTPMVRYRRSRMTGISQ